MGWVTCPMTLMIARTITFMIFLFLLDEGMARETTLRRKEELGTYFGELSAGFFKKAEEKPSYNRDPNQRLTFITNRDILSKALNTLIAFGNLWSELMPLLNWKKICFEKEFCL
ncbi:hypothetical protein ACJX0J_031031, partial [Zea mays]